MAFGATAIATALCCVPALLLGTNAGATLTDYARSVIVSGALLSPDAFGHPPRFTLAGFLAYWAPALAVWPVKLLCAATVVGCVLVGGRNDHGSSRKDTRSHATLLFSLWLVAMLLISPMSELHHEIFLVPIVTFLGLTALGDSGRSSSIAVFGLAAFFLLSLAGGFMRTVPFDFLAISSLLGCGAVLSRIAAREDVRPAPRSLA